MTDNSNEPLVFGRLRGKPGEATRFTRTVTMDELISACCPVDRVYYQYAGPDGQPIVREAGILVLDFVPTTASPSPTLVVEGLNGVTITHQEAYPVSESPSRIGSDSPISGGPMLPPSPVPNSSPQGILEPHTSEPKSKFLTRLLAKRNSPKPAA